MTYSISLYIFDHGIQLIERFDDEAIGFGEDSNRVVEHWRKSCATRADNVCKIIIPHIDSFLRGHNRAFKSMFKESGIWLVGVHLATCQGEIEVLTDMMCIQGFLKGFVAVRKHSHAIARLFQLNERPAHILGSNAF